MEKVKKKKIKEVRISLGVHLFLLLSRYSEKQIIMHTGGKLHSNLGALFSKLTTPEETKKQGYIEKTRMKIFRTHFGWKVKFYFRALHFRHFFLPEEMKMPVGN